MQSFYALSNSHISRLPVALSEFPCGQKNSILIFNLIKVLHQDETRPDKLFYGQYRNFVL
jgi:hypothetical protein